MNTVKLGNEFEDKSYNIIEQALKSNELVLIPEYCKIYRKKPYYSFRRKADIIFDLAIEVTPPKAKNPTLVYLIECKNYTSAVPVSDVATFAEYISQIEGFATKGVFISNNRMQSGALATVKSYGMMLIEVDDNDYNILLYRTEKLKEQNEKEIELDEKVRKPLKMLYFLKK